MLHFWPDLMAFINTDISQKGPTSSFLGKNLVFNLQKTTVDQLYVQTPNLASTILSRQFSRYRIEDSIT